MKYGLTKKQVLTACPEARGRLSKMTDEEKEELLKKARERIHRAKSKN